MPVWQVHDPAGSCQPIVVRSTACLKVCVQILFGSPFCEVAKDLVQAWELKPAAIVGYSIQFKAIQGQVCRRLLPTFSTELIRARGNFQLAKKKCSSLDHKHPGPVDLSLSIGCPKTSPQVDAPRTQTEGIYPKNMIAIPSVETLHTRHLGTLRVGPMKSKEHALLRSIFSRCRFHVAGLGSGRSCLNSLEPSAASEFFYSWCSKDPFRAEGGPYIKHPASMSQPGGVYC